MLAGRTWEMLKELKPAPVSKAERTRLGGAPGSEWEPHSAYIGWENGPGEVFEIKNVKRGGELVAQPTKLVQKVWKNPSTLDCFEELHSNRVYVAVMRCTNLGLTDLGYTGEAYLSLLDLKRFLGIAVFMSIVKLPSKREYWYGAWKVQWLAAIMSYQRWTFIKRHLRLSQTNAAKMDKTSDEYDKAWPIREVADMITEEWFAARQQPERVSMEEQMYGTKGFCLLKTYMPNKPTKRGVKTWCAGDPVTGYAHAVELYCGKTNKEDKGELELARSVVMRLAASFQQYTKFYADNYFCDLGTIMRLWTEQRKYLTGTVQQNRKGWPRDMQPRIENEEKGTSFVKHLVYDDPCEKAKILAVVWQDTKPVRYLSSEAQGVAITMHRRSYVEGTSRNRPAIDVTKLYQDNMGGVDRADSLRSAYGLDFKIPKKWPVVMYLKMLVDTCVNNAYINWLDYQSFPATNKPTGRDFREKLARELCGSSMEQPQLMATHYPIRVRDGPGESVVRNCKVCCGTTFVGTGSNRKQVRTGRRTAYMCARCDVYLCVGDTEEYGRDPKNKNDYIQNCFRIWHCDPQYASQVFM